jgi:hypothetical protein
MRMVLVVVVEPSGDLVKRGAGVRHGARWPGLRWRNAPNWPASIGFARCRPAGCRPSRIASTTFGASGVRRSTRLTWDGARPLRRRQSLDRGMNADDRHAQHRKARASALTIALSTRTGAVLSTPCPPYTQKRTLERQLLVHARQNGGSGTDRLYHDNAAPKIMPPMASV